MTLDCKCFIRANPLPENYTGELTVGNVDPAITPVPAFIMLRFWKRNVSLEMLATITATHAVTVDIDTAAAQFFSAEEKEYSIEIRDTNRQRVKFLDNGQSYDCIKFCFSYDDCGITPNQPFSLTINTEDPCTSC